MSASSIAIRCVFGGVSVVLFSLIGGIVVPKRLSGVFGGAPSVALASLTLTMIKRGGGPIPGLMDGMILGSMAFIAYVLAAKLLCARLSPAIAAFLAWTAWFAVAGMGLLLARA